MSGKGLSPSDAARLEQSFVVGLSRSPPPGVDGLAGAGDATLAALSLLGQRKRFRRHPAGSADIAPFLPADDRPVLPEAARPILRQILIGADAQGSDAIAMASAQSLRERGLRYHPFDLPWLQKHLWHLNEAGDLGVTERFWFKRDGAKPADDPGLLVISDDNWTEFKRAEREVFLTRRRQEDPAVARALLEVCIAGESASVREGLVRALRVRIGPDDRGFLEGLAEDRAKSVRGQAELLLAEISGTEQYTARREAALSRITAKRGGLMSRKTRLSYRGTARVRDPDGQVRDAHRDLGGIAMTDIAEWFDCPVDALLPAAADDHPLYSVLLSTAAVEARWPLLLDWAGGRNGQWDDLLPAICGALFGIPVDRRREIVRTIIERTGLETLGDPIALSSLRNALAGPLDDVSAKRLLAGRGGTSLMAALAAEKPKGRDIDTLHAVATLIPPSLSGQFVTAIERFPRQVALRPTLYHRFVATLDAQTSP